LAERKHRFKPERSYLCVRTTRTGQVKLCIVGETTTGLRQWILAGSRAWKKEAPEGFETPDYSYDNRASAKKDASRIYPTRADFDRFLQHSFDAVAVTGAIEHEFGPPLDPWHEPEGRDVPGGNSDIVDPRDERDLEDDAKMDLAAMPPARRTLILEVVKRNAQRARQLKRDRNYTCERCGESTSWLTRADVPYVEVHHLIPLGENGFDDERNLAVLCSDCHRFFSITLGRGQRHRALLRAQEGFRCLRRVGSIEVGFIASHYGTGTWATVACPGERLSAFLRAALCRDRAPL
jgi:5-methylcytosine-specific restriction endonuclease McrA